jgi:hypothetical protein
MKDQQHIGLMAAGNLLLASASPLLVSLTNWMHLLVTGGQLAAAIVTIVYTLKRMRPKKRKPK